MHRIINTSYLLDKLIFSFGKLSCYIIVTLTFLVYSIFENTVTQYDIF